eukprot:CAMPEP_0194522454 /NCGR_PEP_ID=MMETSP0253-20130528/57029_1 /TAXON_ID=2966 /ORGANISM="Noctiluca scintillans" /LENGTH=82 /DNA_ID=CAMNT_0039366893 /DNA_START=367 /DNA_END=615 /DNA_ORIENTATION=-
MFIGLGNFDAKDIAWIFPERDPELLAKLDTWQALNHVLDVLVHGKLGQLGRLGKLGNCCGWKFKLHRSNLVRPHFAADLAMF